MKKNLVIFFIFGISYNFVEVFYSSLGAHSLSLIGRTSLWMTLVGGALGLTLGMINEPGSPIYKTHPLIKTMAACSLITVIEFIAGCILNLGLGLDIWDYSDMWGNVLGQINPVHTFYWFMMSPLGFWMDDAMRFYLFGEDKPRSLGGYYKALVEF